MSWDQKVNTPPPQQQQIREDEQWEKTNDLNKNIQMLKIKNEEVSWEICSYLSLLWCFYEFLIVN